MMKVVKKPKKPWALVLGMSVNGLSVVRSLGRKGIPVIALDRGLPSGTVRSRFVKEFISVEKEISQTQLLDCLLRIGRSYPRPIFLFPTNDFFVLFISRNREALKPFFSFQLAHPEVIEALIHKRHLCELANLHGVPHPKTFHHPRPEEAEAIGKEIGFPCYIKPVYSHLWREKYSDTKVIPVRNQEELSLKLSQIDPLGLEVIVQEIIPGPADALYAVIAFMDEQTRPLAVCSKRKLRQYPLEAGEGSFQITIQDRRLEEVAVQFLQGLSYVGIAELEFKWDARDGLYKLIEINPRTVTWQELVTQAGVDIPYLSYEYTLNRRVIPLKKYKTGMKWLCFKWDLKAFLETKRTQKITFFEWLHSLNNVKTFAYFSWDDPLPFLIQITQFLIQSFSYVLKIFFALPMNAKQEKPWAVVLGFSINGLSAARSLGRKGIHVIALSRGKPCGAAYSRYAKEFSHIDKKLSDQELLDLLLNIGTSHPNPIFLFPTDDFFVLFVSRNR